MSIKTNELQQLQSILGTDSLLADTAAAGTGRLSLARATEFFGAELIKPGNPVGAALSNKAELSVQQTVEATSVPSRTVEVASSDLQAYLNGLPRLRIEDLTVEVSAGTVPGRLLVNEFYGPGVLIITGTTENDNAIEDGIYIKHCSNRICIRKFNVTASKSSSAIMAYESKILELHNLSINSEKKFCGIQIASYFGFLFVYKCTISNFVDAMYGGGICTLRDCTGANNNAGIAVENGITMLCGSTPELMGGTFNQKDGGLIVKANGTLL